jgi:hypothetical protein
MKMLKTRKVVAKRWGLLLACELVLSLAFVSASFAEDSSAMIDRVSRLAKDPQVFGKYHPGFCLPYAVAFSLRAHTLGAKKVVGVIYDWMDPDTAPRKQTHMIVAIPIEGNVWFWADNQHPGQVVRCSSFYDLAVQASRANAPNHLVRVRAALDLSSGDNQLAANLLQRLRDSNGDFRNETVAFEQQTGLKIPLHSISGQLNNVSFASTF